MWRVYDRVELIVVVAPETSGPRPIVMQTQPLHAEPTSGSSLASVRTACGPFAGKRRVGVEAAESAVRESP
ncbi:hypothetical protein L1987_27537 [Smallanthus sonchifolius]|uniref:Uncharacterized protein n=1 Tax=Smallanthus sonchifolius TaxID=185202 RepID=A0ACB9IAL4_9ASTR|nr:hypothetical protein L1987_27537 [Smallanthus sonchifolius]